MVEKTTQLRKWALADANLNGSTVSIFLTGCFLNVNTAGLELNLNKRKFPGENQCLRTCVYFLLFIVIIHLA